MIKRVLLPTEDLEVKDYTINELKIVWDKVEVGPIHISKLYRRVQPSNKLKDIISSTGENSYPINKIEEIYNQTGTLYDICDSMEENGIISSGSRLLKGEQYPFKRIIELKQIITDERLHFMLKNWNNYKILTKNEKELINLINKHSTKENNTHGKWTDHNFGVYFLNNNEFKTWFLNDIKKEQGVDLLVEIEQGMPLQGNRSVMWGVPPKNIKCFYLRKPGSSMEGFLRNFITYLENKQLVSN